MAHFLFHCNATKSVQRRRWLGRFGKTLKTTLPTQRISHSVLQQETKESQFAVLLKLGHEPQNLLRRRHHFILKVQGAVVSRLLQEVAIVHHDSTGVGHAPGAGVGAPVDPPHGGAVLQVEVGHGVESEAAALLPVEVPGAEAHQDGLQGAGQLLRARPLAAGDQLTQRVDGRRSWVGVDGPLHLAPLLLRQEVRSPAILPVLGQQALKPGREPRNGWKAGKLGHVRELALKIENNHVLKP